MSGSENKMGIRITNYGPTAVALNRLKVKIWLWKVASDDFDIVTFYGNQTLFSPTGQWQATVITPSHSITTLDPTFDCGNSRKANRVITTGFTDGGGVQLAANGGYVETNSGNSWVTWNRSSWQALDSSLDYTKLTDAGANSAGRANSAFVTLYLDDVLVSEWTSATTPDSATGMEPCPSTGGGGGAASFRGGAKQEAPPSDYSLLTAPNPSQGDGEVHFTLPSACSVRLRVSDLSGRTVRMLSPGVQSSGHHELALPADGLAGGVYFVALETDEGMGWAPRRLYKWALVR